MQPAASFQFDPCDPALVDALRRELACTETLAWVLARRGVTPSAARALIEEDPAQEAAGLHDPMLLGDMAAAVERIQYAIETGERIVVHGDYDADGVCSTTLLVEGLEQLGAQDVQAFLPDRFTNGYGLQIEQAERFARDGVRLLITVDCGITAVEPIAHARDLGMDVIVCDHHRPGAVLPDAIIASTRPSDYPFPELCATAVAGKLLVALGGPSGPEQHELEAIATIADCMPLVDENRILVRRGLRALRTTTRPGLLALIDRSGLRPREVDADAVGFKLAPRINAVGRISRSERGYELLRADSAHATALAAEVDATNEERKAITQTIAEQAIAQVEGWSVEARARRIYVVHGRGWHEGVVGIVASKLVERYWRPVIVISDGDPARGSGRSIDGVDLHAALATCDDLLLRWGGHAAAAGVTVDPTRVEELAARLAEWGAQHIPDELLAPRDRIDAVVPGVELRFELVQELERLAPFGTGWERPRLLAVDATLSGTRGVGHDGSHLKATVEVAGSAVPGIGFGLAASVPAQPMGLRFDVALRPTINRFRGAESLQVELDRIYPVSGAAPTFADWCAVGCNAACCDATDAATLLAAATGMLEPALTGADPASPPALEPLLGRPDTVDLRHRGITVEHVAQLLAARRTVVVVVADVPRRRELFEPLLTPGRFQLDGAVLASEHGTPANTVAALRRLAALEPGAGSGARFVLADHATLDAVLDSGLRPDALVVLDPPVTAAHRDLLGSTTVPLHLVFGAREERFASDALTAALDVRGVLGGAWKQLRDDGPRTGDELTRVLRGSGPHRHAPSALIHGLRSLLERGMLRLDDDGSLAAIQPARTNSASGAG